MKEVTLVLLVSAFLVNCTSIQNEYSLQSPDMINTVEFGISENGEAYYRVLNEQTVIIDTSYISFDFQNQPSISKDLTITKASYDSKNETWEMVWGEQREVVNQYNELVVRLEEEQAPNRAFNIHFRAFNDGVAFRYEFLRQMGVDSLIIMEEHTEFHLTDDHHTWWIPADWDSYEHLYNATKISEIDAFRHVNAAGLGHTSIMDNAVHTPVTMRTSEGIHVSIHEAALLDYASMTLEVDTLKSGFNSKLVGSHRLGYKVKRELPFETPWRTIQIEKNAADLIESTIILNLNEPNKIEDTSWIQPMKYMGIWWEMHLEKASWDYGMTMDEDTGTWVDTGDAHGRHGATTENAKRYIDFASANGIKGLLIEGWNTGWERWIGFEDREGVFDFVTTYPDYDIEEVVRYAKEKGVEIIMHHETSAAPRTYEQQLDTAYQLMQKFDMHSVKSGYVGPIIPKGEYHHGQWMVNHYQHALETAIDYQVAINAHEPIKATGLRRTYPNMLTREGLRGQEFNAWAPDGGNPPNHIPTVAFTRMLSGPIDFTPGVFDISLSTKPNNQINTTLAQQLALYVVIYSPLQMACDLPENYENQPAFQFIRDVGVDWEQTDVLSGEIGEYVVIAREERNTGNWFVGGVTNEHAKSYTLNFDFLEEDKVYSAIIYRDTEESHYKNNPTSIAIEEFEVTKDTIQEINMKEGGGFAISLILN